MAPLDSIAGNNVHGIIDGIVTAELHKLINVTVDDENLFCWNMQVREPGALYKK